MKPWQFACSLLLAWILLGCGKQREYEARAIIENARVVSSSRVFEAGSPSRTAWAFTVLYHGDSAEKAARFEDIFRRAVHPEGKIYALAALYRLDRAGYDRLKRQLQFGQAWFRIGCILDVFSAEQVFHEVIPSEPFFRDLLLNPLPEYRDTVEVNLPPYAETGQ